MAISIFKKIIVPILLFHVLSIAFFLSTDLAKDSIFKEPVRYAADDGVYHMRLVENTLLGDHFPKRIYFDPFTYFPYGSYIHFAPLYTFLIAGIIWIISLGQPTLESINQIAPYVPPILGCLTILTIFFIGKVLWNKWAGLLAAFLMTFCQPFLFRSLLGATDHHQAETLFSSLAMLFLILALKNKEKKSFWPWTALAGVGLGLYFLVWNGALLFLFIIFTSLIFYYLLTHFSGKSEEKIIGAGIFIFFITFLMILPFIGHPDIYHARLYDLRHYDSLILAVIGLLTVWLCSKISRKTGRSWTIIIFLTLLGLFFLGLLKIFFEPMFSAITESFKATKTGMVGHEFSRELIGEMKRLTPSAAFQGFGYLFYFSFLGWLLLIADFIKTKKPEKLLVAIWFIVIMLITGVLIPAIGQTRFTYYLSANISIIGAFLAFKIVILILSGWKNSKNSEYKNHLRIGSTVFLFNLIFFLFYPFPFEFSSKMIGHAVQTGISGSIQRPQDWHDTLDWLRENTPDPGLDYYDFYYEPKFNPKINEIEPYPYPETAYGIMTSWDLGHEITYYARRLPIANPFQQGLGIIEENKTIPGETTFFIENNEEKAIEMLQELKARYIVTDYQGADANLGFRAKQLWALKEKADYYFKEGENKGKPTEKYYQSMIARLHYLDGSFYEFEQSNSLYQSLNHFRLIYESNSDASSRYFQEKNDDNTHKTKKIKIFEYVNGAKIKGEVPIDSSIELSCKIITNQEREFFYRQLIQNEEGSFETIVPYSTDKKSEDVFAESCYIKIDNQEENINISEKEVINGLTIKIK
jgi:oligosaccharyl transferase (archaeosortase A-associated)